MQSIFLKFLPCVYQGIHTLYANISNACMGTHSVFREKPVLHKLFLRATKQRNSHALGKPHFNPPTQPPLSLLLDDNMKESHFYNFICNPLNLLFLPEVLDYFCKPSTGEAEAGG